MSESRGRISLARLVLEVRRRSDGKLSPANKQDLDRILDALKRECSTEKGVERVALRNILEVVIGLHRGRELDGHALDSLSPEVIAQLDLVFDAMMDGRVTIDELRDHLRDCLIRIVRA
jgi:hypothetical protein